MACHHSNPAGYVFCSSCGQALDYQQCRCGFICAADALYCGRCGHSLTATETTGDDTAAVSAVEHRYDLDLLMQLAGIHHREQKSNVNEATGIKADQDGIKQMPAAIKKADANA